VNIRKLTALIAAAIAAVLVAACGNLQEQPKLHKPLDASPNFGSAARLPLPETVPVGYLNDDEHLYTGMVDGELVDSYPFEITAEIIEQGRNEYESYCTPCHGPAGYGNGILSQEGFPPPASFHDAEVRERPIGAYFSVITNGWNAMYSYDTRVTPEERWAVIAYIEVLQRSQNVEMSELPAEMQAEFE